MTGKFDLAGLIGAFSRFYIGLRFRQDLFLGLVIGGVRRYEIHVDAHGLSECSQLNQAFRDWEGFFFGHRKARLSTSQNQRNGISVPLLPNLSAPFPKHNISEYNLCMPNTRTRRNPTPRRRAQPHMTTCQALTADNYFQIQEDRIEKDRQAGLKQFADSDQSIVRLAEVESSAVRKRGTVEQMRQDLKRLLPTVQINEWVSWVVYIPATATRSQERLETLSGFVTAIDQNT